MLTMLMRMQQRDLFPLRDTLLAMTEAVAKMQPSQQRADLEAHIADAVEALSRFSTYILKAAMSSNLSNHHIAEVNSSSYSRLSSRAATSAPPSVRADT